MHGPPPLLGIRDRLDGVHGRLRPLELLAVLDDRPGLVEAGAQLLGPRVGGGLRPGPSPDGSPQCREADGHSPGEEREASVHEADATLPPASCPARERRPKRHTDGRAA